jgi:acyl-coenzyme A synthetase/AMP-(fatty) acid ligase
MANYKVPRHVELVDALPTNASGKVLKTELRRLAQSAEGSAEDSTEPAGETEDREGT